MPLLLPIDRLRPQMRLAANAMDGFNLLLPTGWELSAEDIELLKSSLPESHVAVKTPALDQHVNFEDHCLDEKISLEVRHGIGELFKELSAMMRSGAELNDEYILGTRRIIAKALARVQYNPVQTAILCNQRSGEDYLACHTANVFHLSIVMGAKLLNYIKEQRQRSSAATDLANAASLGPLATGTAFHDIALICSRSRRDNSAALSAINDPSVRHHPAKGADLLSGKISAMARAIIRSHHENFNGSGYPQEIAGEKINVYARILRVADAYCTATAPQSGRNCKSAAAALDEMVNGGDKQLYDPTILQAFAGVIQPWANGTVLKLKTGESVVVVGHNAQDPLKPKVYCSRLKKPVICEPESR